MSYQNKKYTNTIDRVDNMIRQNNKKYLDQKSQIQYEKALQQYQKQQKRQITKSYAQNIKQGNKKAIQKKLLQQKQIKNKLKQQRFTNKQQRLTNRSKTKSQLESNSLLTNQNKILFQKPVKQKLSQKQIKKVQKTIQARAQRHLQQLQLQRLNNKLQQQKKRTKLYELKQTCKKLLSKSHKRIPAISDKIPQQRKVLLQQYSKKAQDQVQQLDNIIFGLIQKSKINKYGQQHVNNNKRQIIQSKTLNNNKKVPSLQQNNLTDDIFSDKFEIQFMKQIVNGNHDNHYDNVITNKRGIQFNYNNRSEQDILFTKSASQLFQMKYIPLHN